MTNKDRISLFPVMKEALSRRQKDYILKNLEGITLTDLEEYSQKYSDIGSVRKICEKLTDAEREEAFLLARKLCDVEYLSFAQLEALAELGELLAVDSEKTGFSFDLYSVEERKEYECQRIFVNYAIMASVVELFPFSGILSYSFTTPLQVMMVNRVAKLYDFDLDARRLITMATGTAGVNLFSKLFSWGITRFLPFKWFFRTSVEFASTYSIGLLAKAYIAADGKMEADVLYAMFENGLEEGKIIFRQFKEYILVNKDKLVTDFKNHFLFS